MAQQGARTPHFDKYAILGKWATGGMAKIYVARQIGTQGFDKLVGLKLLKPEFVESREFVDMFFAEARTGALLHHPSIVQTYDVGEIDGQVYMVLEFINGETLSRVIRALRKDGKKLDTALAIDICIDMAEALHYAHTLRNLQGEKLSLVHRDVSPSNIMLTHQGSVKLLDFGIAKVATRASLTKAGQIKGKFAYMSPEQAQAEELDGRSDVFALALVLWQMLTGKRAYDYDSELVILNAIINEALEAPSAHRSELEPELDAIVLKAAEKDRDLRFENAKAFSDALRIYRQNAFPGYSKSDTIAELMADYFGDRAKKLQSLVSSPINIEPAPTGNDPDEWSLPSFSHSRNTGSMHTPISSSSVSVSIPRASQPNLARFDGDDLTAVDRPSRRNLMPSEMERRKSNTPLIAIVAILVVGLIVIAFLFTNQDKGATQDAEAAAVAEPIALTITSIPANATVRVNGNEVGITSNDAPLSVEFETGASASIVIQRKGFKLWRKKVEVNSDTAFVEAFLEEDEVFGSLTVNSTPPGATVTIDGTTLEDPTPTTVHNLWIGKPHSVVFTLKGYQPVVEEITFDDEGNLPLNVSLKQTQSGFIAAYCDPTPCDVYVDGRNVGVTPLKSMEFPAGQEFQIQLRQGAEEFVSETIKLGAGELIPISYTAPELLADANTVAAVKPTTKASKKRTSKKKSSTKKATPQPPSSTTEAVAKADTEKKTETKTTAEPKTNNKLNKLVAASSDSKLDTSASGGSDSGSSSSSDSDSGPDLKTKLASFRMDGIIDRRKVKSLLQSLQSKIHGCYTKAYASKAFAEDLELSFRISTSGRMGNFSLSGSNASRVRSCVEKHLESLDFPKSTGSDSNISVKIRYSD